MLHPVNSTTTDFKTQVEINVFATFYINGRHIEYDARQAHSIVQFRILTSLGVVLDFFSLRTCISQFLYANQLHLFPVS